MEDEIEKGFSLELVASIGRSRHFKKKENVC